MGECEGHEDLGSQVAILKQLGRLAEKRASLERGGEVGTPLKDLVSEAHQPLPHLLQPRDPSSLQRALTLHQCQWVFCCLLPKVTD